MKGSYTSEAKERDEVSSLSYAFSRPDLRTGTGCWISSFFPSALFPLYLSTSSSSLCSLARKVLFFPPLLLLHLGGPLPCR